MVTTIAYLDCPVGIAGDMCLGALVSAGVPLDYLNQVLSQLSIDQEVKVWSELVQRHGQEALKVHVELLDHHSDHLDSHDSESHEHSEHHHFHSHHRHLPEIEQIIQASNLPQRVKDWSLTVFRKLAIAEGSVHGIPLEQVHFHEVGALDAIVDIVGTCAGLDWLGVEQVFCSPLPVGGGFANCEHGKLPVPVPAVLKLWELHQVPVFSNGIKKELVTPTGAAIAVALSQAFGDPPAMTLEKVGLGAGSQDLELPNLVRLWLGKRDVALRHG
ncbi:nickel pincer cofactor biosynthesis protein LarC [Pantanalinema rosaneae CENA516]|uniref:nickel pincer cofactor biosynthesis protein LarC n=1 Tax=Pantanalinema rosaneae TaxID=1620701 RepID=UPI003D6E3AFD